MWRFLPILVTVCLEVFQVSTCQASACQTSTCHAAETQCATGSHCLADKPTRCAAEPCDASEGAAIIAASESPDDDDQLHRGAGGPNCQTAAFELSSVVRLAAQSALLGPARPLRILFECWRN